MGACGAKTKAGTACRRQAGEAGRCRQHRDIAPEPTASGRHAPWLPDELARRYEERLSDPDLVTNRAEIALMDTRVGQLLQQLDAGGGRELWAEARAGFSALKAAAAKGPDGLMDLRVAMGQLDEVLNEGGRIGATWDDIMRALEQRRRLSDSELRRLKELNLVVSTRHALNVTSVLIDLIRRHVTDTNEIASIFGEFRRLFSRGNAEAARP